MEKLEQSIDSETEATDGGFSPSAGGLPLPPLTGLKGFSEEDLRQNESGRLSETQQAELRAAARGDWLWMAAALALITIWSVVSGIYLIGVIYAGVILVTGLSRILKKQAALFHGTVSAVDGDATKWMTGGGDDEPHYWLRVGDLRLEMTSDAYLRLPQGGPYRVYYLPEARRLISAKPLPGWRYIPWSPASNRRSWWKSISLELG